MGNFTAYCGNSDISVGKKKDYASLALISNASEW